RSRETSLPPDPDDDDGGSPGGRPARDRLGNRRRAPPAARDSDRRRADLLPAPDALHDARHLSGLRPARPALCRSSQEGIYQRAPAGGHRVTRDSRPETRDSQSATRNSLSSPFIHRPIATTLLTVAVALAGAIAYKLLP